MVWICWIGNQPCGLGVAVLGKSYCLLFRCAGQQAIKEATCKSPHATAVSYIGCRHPARVRSNPGGIVNQPRPRFLPTPRKPLSDEGSTTMTQLKSECKPCSASQPRKRLNSGGPRPSVAVSAPSTWKEATFPKREDPVPTKLHY